MKIALLGDIALFGKMSIKGTPSIKENLSEIADYLGKFDYVVGNLETPFSVKKKTNGAKSAYICSDVENVQLLQHLHINAVTLANNHMFDYGAEGYETTKKVLKENGIEFFGTEGKELLIEKNGDIVSFSGFCCYSSNPLRCVPNGEYGVNAYNVANVKDILQKNKRQGCLSIVAVHAGLEHVNYPSIEHIRAARLLAHDTPYVYYGHHPHVVQGIEKYEGSVIAHSLGNFCFDDVYTDNSAKPLVVLTENNRTGAILEVDIERGKVVKWKMQGVYFNKEGRMMLLDKILDAEEYNRGLENAENDVDEYTNKRNRIISTRLSERKSARTLVWYLKRLRLRYVQILINAQHNEKKYQKNVLKYL